MDHLGKDQAAVLVKDSRRAIDKASINSSTAMASSSDRGQWV